jgi:hypothetical protein
MIPMRINMNGSWMFVHLEFPLDQVAVCSVFSSELHWLGRDQSVPEPHGTICQNAGMEFPCLTGHGDDEDVCIAEVWIS